MNCVASQRAWEWKEVGRFRGNVRLEWELRACDCNQMELGYMERNRELYIFS